MNKKELLSHQTTIRYTPTIFNLLKKKKKELGINEGELVREAILKIYGKQQ